MLRPAFAIGAGTEGEAGNGDGAVRRVVAGYRGERRSWTSLLKARKAWAAPRTMTGYVRRTWKRKGQTAMALEEMSLTSRVIPAISGSLINASSFHTRPDRESRSGV